MTTRLTWLYESLVERYWKMQSLKCTHEWRLLGTRLDESGKVAEGTAHSSPVVCTKCGTEQYADGYEYIEERPVPEYSGSWASFAQDIIVKVKKFGHTELTQSGFNPRTKKDYDEARFKWDAKAEQWIKTYPITWKDYWKAIRETI